MRAKRRVDGKVSKHKRSFGSNRAAGPFGDEHTAERAAEGHRKTLERERTYHAPSGCADREPDSQFPPPRVGPRHQQRSQIEACDAEDGHANSE